MIAPVHLVALILVRIENHLCIRLLIFPYEIVHQSIQVHCMSMSHIHIADSL